ncbi:hypothetical protein [uncultured Methylobacterium sp.]|uniref:hypothetical protein n=1 Tax=uncultured Methylobacterium sp. TaxID=157278 RepID=UPI0035C943E3
MPAGWRCRATAGLPAKPWIRATASSATARGGPIPDLIVRDADQEHGIVALRPGSAAALPDLPLGARLRPLPNHACATGAQHACYHVRDAAGCPPATWPRINGW